MFAYFDETGMHESAPDTVVAGYLFEKNKAKDFRCKFRQRILPLLPVNKKGKRIFHASKCCPSFGNAEYESIRNDERQKIVSRLSWKWRKRSSVKIAERTYEKRAQALHC